MSLSALINGADCGPSNALQGLTKRHDSDRGVAGDQLLSLTGVFHSQPTQVPAALAQEAAEFFNGGSSRTAAPQLSPFDLRSLDAALANVPQRPVVQGPAVKVGPTASWANDFVESTVSAQAIPAKPAFSWAADFATQEAVGRSATPQVQPVNRATQVPHIAMRMSGALG